MIDSEGTVTIPVQYTRVIDDVIRDEKISACTTEITSASNKGENFLGLLFKLTVTGVNKYADEVKKFMILKVPPQSQLWREKSSIETLYKREVFMYNRILPELGSFQDTFNVPESERFQFIKCHRAESIAPIEYLLLDDISVEGYSMANRRESLRYSHLKILLKTLASFHASSFVLKKLRPDLFREFAKHAGGFSDYNDEYIAYFDLTLNRAKEVMEDRESAAALEKYGENLSDKLKSYLNPELVAPYSVLCHGDCWNNNAMFQFKDGEPTKVMLLDWQIARNCSPITDIAYLIFSSTDYETRKEHLAELLDYYYERLGISLGYMDCDINEYYPRAVFDDHLKKILPYGLFMSFMLLPAVLGEAEDVPDMDALLSKDKIDQSDLKFENKQSSSRFEIRMRGVVRTAIEMDMI